MLKDEKDQINLSKLLDSLDIWKSKHRWTSVYHINYEKETGTLYRFGWFIINGYKHSVVGWQFKTGVVTFENEKTHEKIKYDLIDHCVLYSEFKKDNILLSIKKRLFNKLSLWLKDLSDKLQS